MDEQHDEDGHFVSSMITIPSRFGDSRSWPPNDLVRVGEGTDGDGHSQETIRRLGQRDLPKAPMSMGKN